MVATLFTPVVQSLRDEKSFDEKAIDELKKCLHQNSTDVYFQIRLIVKAIQRVSVFVIQTLTRQQMQLLPVEN